MTDSDKFTQPSDKFTQPSTAKLYLERLQVDFLHRQSAVFCEKLCKREITVRSVEELLVGFFCADVSCKKKKKQAKKEQKIKSPTCRCCKSSSWMFWERLYT